jgi:hypothetical protein
MQTVRKLESYTERKNKWQDDYELWVLNSVWDNYPNAAIARWNLAKPRAISGSRADFW